VPEPTLRELKVDAAGVGPSRADLGISAPTPVLAVAGTTTTLEPDIVDRLLPVLKAVVAGVADRGAVIVTGGTDAGVFHVLGLAIESSRRQVSEVGVAPDGVLVTGGAPTEGRSAVDPRLSVLVRVEGDQWGDETPMLSRVVAEITGAEPAVVLLVGGGEVARAELAEHLRRGRTIVVLEGSGRLADDVAAGLTLDTDPDLRALVKAGDVRRVPLGSSPRAIAETVGRAFDGRQRSWAVLSVFPRWPYRPGHARPLIDRDARERFPMLARRISEADEVIYPAFAEYDRQALIEQNRYRWFVVSAIFGGLLTTVFGAVQAWLQSTQWPGVVVATLGAATTALTTVARRQGSLQQYLTARLRAERLRSLYFQHIATPPPLDSDDQTDRLDLETQVARVRYEKVTM
jgi:hypothetical protein